VLVMTATPIPRSLALAQYGDMDVSLLDEKPPGRTAGRHRAGLGGADGRGGRASARSAVAEGRQAYWVCPLVEESRRST
jgi:ATP-dependent DNA helicase RecG